MLLYSQLLWVALRLQLQLIFIVTLVGWWSMMLVQMLIVLEGRLSQLRRSIALLKDRSMPSDKFELALTWRSWTSGLHWYLLLWVERRSHHAQDSVTARHRLRQEGVKICAIGFLFVLGVLLSFLEGALDLPSQVLGVKRPQILLLVSVRRLLRLQPCRLV